MLCGTPLVIVAASADVFDAEVGVGCAELGEPGRIFIEMSLAPLRKTEKLYEEWFFSQTLISNLFSCRLFSSLLFSSLLLSSP